jgi:DNA-binding MarR family transcriptional regulator
MTRRRVRAALDRPSAIDYRTLSDFRYQVRRFLRTREIAAHQAGIEPQQYLVLLHVKGLDGTQPTTIGALAERMQLQHHGVVQLIDRLVKRGMVNRQRGADRRQAVITLTARGESLLRRLVRYSVAELKTEGPLLVASLRRLVLKSANGSTPALRRRVFPREA